MHAPFTLVCLFLSLSLSLSIFNHVWIFRFPFMRILVAFNASCVNFFLSFSYGNMLFGGSFCNSCVVFICFYYAIFIDSLTKPCLYF